MQTIRGTRGAAVLVLRLANVNYLHPQTLRRIQIQMSNRADRIRRQTGSQPTAPLDQRSGGFRFDGGPAPVYDGREQLLALARIENKEPTPGRV